jgi:hypothetical protein
MISCPSPSLDPRSCDKAVWLDAQKRTLTTANVGDLAKASCAHLTNAAESKDCIDTTVASHKASVVGVVIIYLTFRDFLPWLNGPGYDLDQSAASAVKKAVSRLDFAEAVSIIKKSDRRQMVGALNTILQCLAA